MIAMKDKQATKPVPSEVKQMVPATRELYDRIKVIYESATSDELKKRHEIGELVKALTADERKYGQDVLSPVSAALGVCVDYLYHCQKLASTWTLEEIEKLRGHVNCFGRRIEFTHLNLIASLPGSKMREQLIEEFFLKGLTTRELEQRIKQLTHGAKGKPSTRPRSPSAGLTSMQKMVTDYGEKCAVWQETVFEPIRDTASNCEKLDCFEDLVAAKESHEELCRQVEQNIVELAKCIQFAEQARDELQKKKRRPKTTKVTPSRPPLRKPPAKATTTGRRRLRVV